MFRQEKKVEVSMSVHKIIEFYLTVITTLLLYTYIHITNILYLHDIK